MTVLVQALVDGHGIDLALSEDEGAVSAKVLAKELDLETLLAAEPSELLFAVADVLGNGEPVLIPVVGDLRLLPAVGGSVIAKQAAGPLTDLAGWDACGLANQEAGLGCD